MKKYLQSGFTLMEVLIVLACSMIVGTILVTILIQGGSIFSNQTSKVNQNLSLNNASYQITQNIQYASQIAASFTNGSTTYTTSSTVLVAKIPAIDASGNIIENTHDTVIIMADPVKNSLLKKLVFPDILSNRAAEDMTLLTNLSLIQFTYLNDNAVPTTPQTASRVDYIIKVAEKVNIGLKESSLSGRINLKNI